MLLSGMLDMVPLLLVLVDGLLVQALREMVDVVVGGCLIRRGRLDLGVDGLVEMAELERLLRVDQVLRAGRGRVEGVVVLMLLGLGRRRILGHLR